VTSIVQEIELTKDYLGGDRLESIYFGGGTPSLLSATELKAIFSALKEHHDWDPSIEITLEANPEDLTDQYCDVLIQSGVNRLSIGIQSFVEEDLKLMNRAHNAEQSDQALKAIIKAGFSNYSLDLMFGLINSNIDSWRENLERAAQYRPNHMSCYNLTIEEQTAFGKWYQDRKIVQPKEEIQYEQFMLAHEFLMSCGYDHYEISNYAQEGHRAIHNTNYWKAYRYLGIGPAAHSYDGKSRRWNIANNKFYQDKIREGILPIEEESLSEKDRYNEIIMLGLRTEWGVRHESIQSLNKSILTHYQKVSQQLIDQGLILYSSIGIKIPIELWYSCDDISAQLFYT
jgi:oxygen-independent coproporphyrinogen III oxidase